MKIVLATGNQGKLKELQSALHSLEITLLAQSTLQVPTIEETGLSFVENAILKARNAAKHSDLPAIADDSGLAVDALGGAPGIFSARYAGSGASDQDNIQKLLSAVSSLKEKDRAARFYCAIAFVRHESDPVPIICQGIWEGRLLAKPQGTNGFGYDPIFLVPALNCSAAELTPDQKSTLSHRAKALAEFRQQFSHAYGNKR
jgi:XTP/dITP diphosphohydrolase